MIKLNLFKKWFGDKMSYEFKNIKVADIENQINLIPKAESDGKNNIPSESSERFSITENEAITKYDEKRHQEIIQKLTDKYVKIIDDCLDKKQVDILTV